MDTKMTKPEKMDIKDMNKKDQQEKPSPKPDQTNKREPPSPAHNQQNRQNQNQQNRQHQNQQNRQQHQNQQNMRDQMNKNNDSQNESMDQGENAPKKFTGRCRLFVGNLPNDTTEEQFRALFTPYGELSEVFVNPSRGFGFVRLVSNAHVIFLKLPVLFNEFVALFHQADAVILDQNDSSRVGDGVHFEGLKEQLFHIVWSIIFRIVLI